MNPTDVIQATQEWLSKAVIGLNLCPFAKAVHIQEQIRYVVSDAETTDDLLLELIRELEFLAKTDAHQTDTTLLIHPQVLNDFLDFNDFLEVADAAILELGFDGVLQIASFHPEYQFDGTESADITNFTNRSPYPTLHILRESSVEKAAQSVPDASDIFNKNMETLRNLGIDGWQKLFKK